MNHKDMWINAYYLIEAKKSIDTLWFVYKYLNRLRYVDVKSITSNAYTKFYLNCCYVIDRSYDKKERFVICDNDPYIKALYDERNKNRAHKDYDYKPPEFKLAKEIIINLKVSLDKVKEACESVVPAKLTFDYVPFDPILFRFVYRVNDEQEEVIRYKKLNKNKRYFYLSIFSHGHCERVCGINIYETLQNAQFDCLCRNINEGTNDWYKLDYTYVCKINRLQEIGYLDVFETRVSNINHDKEMEVKTIINSILEKCEAS